MISKIIGLYLLLDGIFSWIIYKRQKVLVMKRKTISVHPLLRINLKRIKKAKLLVVNQSEIEHISRFIRAGIGLGLLLSPLPF